MSSVYDHKSAISTYRGKSTEKEIQDFFKKSTLQRIQDERESQAAVEDLRAENARRRLQDQRDLDADYRNYIIPV
jgi:hypothetical protein